MWKAERRRFMSLVVELRLINNKAEAQWHSKQIIYLQLISQAVGEILISSTARAGTYLQI